MGRFGKGEPIDRKNPSNDQMIKQYDLLTLLPQRCYNWEAQQSRIYSDIDQL